MRERTVDVRLIAATNRAPMTAIDDGLLREDLFYRLYVIPIELPPLRERHDDVLMIAESLLARYSQDEGRSFTGISAGAKEKIRNHPWPGNVRELQNAIRRAVVMNDSNLLTADMLLQDLAQNATAQALPSDEALFPTPALGLRPEMTANSMEFGARVAPTTVSIRPCGWCKRRQ